MKNELPINTMQDLVTAGELISQTMMAGAGNPAEGFIIAAHCFQHGISWLDFADSFNVVKGRVSMRADAMAANFGAAGGVVEVIQRDSHRCELKLSMKGRDSAVFQCQWEGELELEPFVKGKGGKGLKQKYETPRSRMQMMHARVISDALRAYYPEANKGKYTPEEVEDFDDAPSAAVATVSVEDLTAAAEPVAATVPDEFQTVPMGMGESSGKPWSDLELDMLKAGLTLDDARMTAGHRTAIQAELTRRGAK